MKTPKEMLEDSMRYRATDLNSMSDTARILRAMQEYAEEYHQEEMRSELAEVKKAAMMLFDMVHESDLIQNKIKANELYDIIKPK